MDNCVTCIHKIYNPLWVEYKCALTKQVVKNVEDLDCPYYIKGAPVGPPPKPPNLLTTDDHTRLKNRDRYDQHPIKSITGLRDELDSKLSKDAMVNAIDQALAQAKESGEFDGEDGKTPVRGEDYWTPDDKSEITAEVVEELKDVEIIVNDDHAALKNRDVADAHPISAITHLQNKLDTKMEGAGFLTNLEIQAILDS